MRFSTCHPDRKYHAKGMCKSCYNISIRKQTSEAKRKSHIVKTIKWQKDNQDKVKSARYMRRYGITLLDVRAMAEVQNNCCGICKKPTKVLHVDHHHDSGTVRGLLCGTCNRGVGNLKECTDVLLSAVKYLLYWATRYKDKGHV